MKKLDILKIFIVLVTCVIAGLGINSYLKNMETEQELKKMSLEKEYRELELKEREVEALEEQNEIKKEESSNKVQALDSQQEFELTVTKCISEAQTERNRRNANINMIWLECRQDPLFSTSECEKYKDTSTVDGYYSEWVSNCKIGLKNNYQNR